MLPDLAALAAVDPMILAVAAPAVLIAGISKGGFGAGAAFAATPILALALEPAMAVGVMLPLLMVMDLTGLRAWRGRWNLRAAAPLMVGAPVGVALGALVFTSVPADAVRLAIGLVALGFLGFEVARSRGWSPGGPVPAGAGGAPAVATARDARGGAWGAVAGFTSFVSHAGGPPAAVHLLSLGLTRGAYQATTVIVFWWINVVKIGPYLAAGLVGRETLAVSVWLAPIAVGGILLGVIAHRKLDERWWFRIIRVLLAVTGAKLVWDGAAGVAG